MASDPTSISWHDLRVASRSVISRWRWPLLAGLVVVAVVVAAWAFDAARGAVVANGVHAGPVKLGGLSTAAAQRRLEGVIARHQRHRIVVIAGDQRLTLVPAKAGVGLDVHGMVSHAASLGQGSNFISRDVRELTGSSVHASISPQLTPGSQAALRHLAAQLNRKPRDAAVAAGPDGLHVVPDQSGLAVQPAALAHALGPALLSGAPKVSVPVHKLPAGLTIAHLQQRYPAYITIDRGNFRLRVYQHLKLMRSYSIAVGMQGLETPAGLYHIQNKEVDPAWDVPNSSWAGSLAGQHIPPGPDDPLKARWLGLFNGAGIHGTDETDSIGSFASHGCVRMLIPDVIDLYDRVQVGTPVYIGD